MKNLLVADIGGTNTRLRITDINGNILLEFSGNSVSVPLKYVGRTATSADCITLISEEFEQSGTNVSILFKSADVSVENSFAGVTSVENMFYNCSKLTGNAEIGKKCKDCTSDIGFSAILDKYWA